MQTRQANTIDVLNEALITVYRSLPMFIGEARPYTHAGDEPAERLLAHIVADQKAYAGRLADMIQDVGGAPYVGSYSMIYADLHLLSLEYLLGEVTAQQERDVATLADCVATLGGNDRARALVEEIHGNARGHLQSLKELSVATAGK